MPSQPDSVSKLRYHWTNHTGRPLEPQVRWDATGTTLADASTQWCPSGDPVLICIIGTHWNTTGRPLETHWLQTILSPVAFQCTLGSKFRAHWIATGLPLDHHWLRVREDTTVDLKWKRPSSVTSLMIHMASLVASSNILLYYIVSVYICCRCPRPYLGSEAKYQIHASLNWEIIGSNNGLSPIRLIGLSSITAQGTYFIEKC